MCNAALSLVMTIFVECMHHCSGEIQVPQVLRAVLLDHLGCCLGYRQKNQKNPLSTDKGSAHTSQLQPEAGTTKSSVVLLSHAVKKDNETKRHSDDGVTKVIEDLKTSVKDITSSVDDVMEKVDDASQTEILLSSAVSRLAETNVLLSRLLSERIMARDGEEEEQKLYRREWQDCAVIINRIFVIIDVVVFVVITVVCLLAR